MSKSMRWVSALLWIVILLSALGCGAAGREALYGKWQYVAGDTVTVWEFKKDGGFVLHIDEGSMDSTFEFVDDDTIILVAPEAFGGEDATLDFKIDGDQVTFSSKRGDSIVFTRVQ